MKDLENTAAMFNEEAERYHTAAVRLKLAKQRIKDAIIAAAQKMGVTDIEGQTNRFKISPAAGKLEITSEEAIPAEFKTVETVQVVKIDKERIKNYLKEGFAIEGAKFIPSFSLREYVVKK